MNQMKKIDASPGDVRIEGAQVDPSASGPAGIIAVRRSRLRIMLMTVVPLLIAAIGLYFWLTGGKSVETDNAYVKQDIVSISTQVNGPVVRVFEIGRAHV